jgi:hypothetical protein
LFQNGNLYDSYNTKYDHSEYAVMEVDGEYELFTFMPVAFVDAFKTACDWGEIYIFAPNID